MAEQTGGAGGGAGEGAAGAGSGGAPGTAGAGEGKAAGGGSAGTVATAPALNDILPDEFKQYAGNPAMLKEALSTTVRLAKARQQDSQELRQLREQVGKLSETKKADEKPPKPYEERIYEDAEGTIAEIVEKKFGERFTRTEATAGEGLFRAARSEYPDFKEHEDDIRALLKDSSSPMDEDHIRGAYIMTLGSKALKDRQLKAREEENAVRPGGTGGEETKPKVEPLSKLEDDIRKQFGYSEADWRAYKEKDYAEVKVPTGKKEPAKA